MLHRVREADWRPATGRPAGRTDWRSWIGELPRAFEEIHRVLRPGGLFLVAFHIGAEVRHLDEWWGLIVDVDFRFLQPPEITGAIERAGFQTEMRLERVSYPGEVETRRAYLLTRRQT